MSNQVTVTQSVMHRLLSAAYEKQNALRVRLRARGYSPGQMAEWRRELKYLNESIKKAEEARSGK